MATEVKVPTLGESVTEATVGQWLKKPGEAVKVDEPIVSLETDKVAVDVPSTVAGVMGDIDIATKLSYAAADSGDEVWHMPLPQYLRPVLASDVADIANSKVGNTAAGMLLGGIFLKEFVGQRAPNLRFRWRGRQD